jgi:alpha-tubulin suppressor-like RCC1 family protein
VDKPTKKKLSVMNLSGQSYPSLSVHCLLLTREGHLLSWGNNDYGSLGDSERKTQPEKCTPRRLIIPGVDEKEILSVGVGCYHNLLLTRDSTLYAWGRDVEKQLALPGDRQDRFTPERVNAFPEKLAQVSCGAFFSAAISEQGNVYLWGDNSGFNWAATPVPYRLEVPSPAISLSCGWEHVIILTRDGVYAWGKNGYGQLGVGDTNARASPTRLDLTDVVQVVCGDNHSLALQKNGAVYTWGKKLVGGDSISVLRPEKVIDGNVIALSAGASGSMALFKDGTISTWGNNCCGQLGAGRSDENHDEPFKITLDSDEPRAVFIGSGFYHNFAISEHGDLYLWGQGTDCQLGLGSPTDVSKPTILRNFKFRWPNKEEKWRCVMRWLFLGKLDENSIFYIFPIEVLFNFSKLDFF